MLVIVQARLSSKRFPNKVLYLIKKKPLILYLIENLKKSKNQLKIVIATSKNKSDDKIFKFCETNNIFCFRGSLNNVAERLLQCAKKFKAKNFIRICGDSPFIDAKLIDKAIDIYLKSKNKYELISNIFPRTFSSGQSVEIIRTNLLSKNLKFFSKSQKEHVTKYFYENNNCFMIKNFKNINKKKKIKMSIDTKSDLHRLKKKF